MPKRIYLSANCILILFFFQGCASSSSSSSEPSASDLEKEKSINSSKGELSSVENASSVERASKKASSSTFDENSSLINSTTLVDNQESEGETVPKLDSHDDDNLTAKEKIQPALGEGIQETPENLEASFEYDKDKAHTSPSVAESPLRIEGHSELKSFFDSNQENENSNSSKKEGLSESQVDHVENDTLKPLNLNSKPVQIHSPEDNQGNKDEVGISNHLPLEFDPLDSGPLGNSDLPTLNEGLNEADFTKENTIISVDNEKLPSKFLPRTSSVEIIDQSGKEEAKVGFRNASKERDSLNSAARSVSFLEQSSEDFSESESGRPPKIVSFKNVPIGVNDNKLMIPQAGIVFSEKNKPSLSSTNKPMPNVSLSDSLSNNTQTNTPNTSRSSFELKPKEKLGYEKLKSFPDRKVGKSGSSLKGEYNKFPNTREYLDDMNDGGKTLNLPSEQIERRDRFLRTKEWIENRGRLKNDLKPE